MSILTKLTNNIKNIAGTAYNYILPNPARKYATAGIKAVSKLFKDVVIDSVATLWLTVKSFCAGIPAGCKSVASATRALFWNIPKAAYYSYQGDKQKAQTALKQVREDANNAANRLLEAISISASVAYNGIKPILSDVTTSITYNGTEAVLDAGALASIGLIESGKALNSTVLAPLASQLAEVISTLETMATQKASTAYNALPSLPVTNRSASLLLGFNAIQASQANNKLLATAKPQAEIEMAVINSLNATPAAA